jgi:uncharacterized membrane protein HdeD (DUF308 family)
MKKAIASAAQGMPNRDWRGFAIVGLVLIVSGAIAVLTPALATTLTTTVLGGGLTIAGVISVYQAMRDSDWAGCNWQLLLGAAEVAGGIFIIINPLKGAAAVTLAVAVTILALGIAQIGLALKIRPQSGWDWLVVAGVASVVIGIALIMRFPFGLTESPGAMAGISLLCGGIAHLVLAVGRRRAFSDRV